MKSLQERIAWYETHFPDMVEQGVIRFHDSSTQLSETRKKENLKGQKAKIGRNSAHTYRKSSENIKRTKQELPLVTDIYLSGEDLIHIGLCTHFNFSIKPNYSVDIQDDHVFF
jgi:hypothetical protein